MRVLDGACMVYCAVGGVQPQSETVWRQANNTKCLVSLCEQMDRTGANFFKVVEQMKLRLKATLCQSVFRLAPRRTSLAWSICKMKAIIWDEASQGIEFTFEEILLNSSHRPKNGARRWLKLRLKP